MPNIFPNLYAIVEDKLMRVEANKPQEKGVSLLTLKARREQIHHLYTQWSNNQKYGAYLKLLGDFEAYFTDAVMLKKEEEDSLEEEPSIIEETDIQAMLPAVRDFPYSLAVEIFLGLSQLRLTAEVVYCGKDNRFLEQLKRTMDILGMYHVRGETHKQEDRQLLSQLMKGIYRLVYALSTEKALREPSSRWGQWRLKIQHPQLIQQLLSRKWDRFLALQPGQKQGGVCLVSLKAADALDETRVQPFAKEHPGVPVLLKQFSEDETALPLFALYGYREGAWHLRGLSAKESLVFQGLPFPEENSSASCLLTQDSAFFTPTVFNAIEQRHTYPEKAVSWRRFGAIASPLRQESVWHLLMRHSPNQLPQEALAWLTGLAPEHLSMGLSYSLLGQTPLHLAVYSGQTAWLKQADKRFLLTEDALGLTQLHVAVMLGNVEAIQACWRFNNYGAYWVNPADAKAANQSKTHSGDVPTTLLENKVLEADCRGYRTFIFNQTALHLVFQEGLVPTEVEKHRRLQQAFMLQALLSHQIPALILEERDWQGLTVLQYALFTHQEELIAPLLRAGADRNARWDCQPPQRKPTTTHTMPVKFPSFVGSLSKGSTALHYACQSPFMPIKVITLLLTTETQPQGAPLQIMSRDEQQRTALEALLVIGCSLLYRYGTHLSKEANRYLRWLLLVMHEVLLHQGPSLANQLDANDTFYLDKSVLTDLSVAQAQSLEAIFSQRLTIAEHLHQLQIYLKAHPVVSTQKPCDIRCLIENWEGLVSSRALSAVRQVQPGEGAKTLKKQPRNEPLLQLLSSESPSAKASVFFHQRAQWLSSHMEKRDDELKAASVPNVAQVLHTHLFEHSSAAIRAYYHTLSTRMTGQLLGSLVALGEALQSKHNLPYDKVMNFITKASRAVPVFLGVAHLGIHAGAVLLQLGMEVLEYACEGVHLWEFFLASRPGVEHAIREYFTGQHAHFSRLASLLGGNYAMGEAAFFLGRGLAQYFALHWSYAIEHLSEKQAEDFAEATFKRFMQVTQQKGEPLSSPVYFQSILHAMSASDLNKTFPKALLSAKEAHRKHKRRSRWTSDGLLSKSWVVIGHPYQPMVFALGKKEKSGEIRLHPHAEKYAQKYAVRWGSSTSVLQGNFVPVAREEWSAYASIKDAITHYQNQWEQLSQLGQALIKPSCEAIPSTTQTPSVSVDEGEELPKKEVIPSELKPSMLVDAIADDDSSRFRHDFIKADGNCGFTALGVTREVFVNAFNQDNQLCLTPEQLRRMVEGILLSINDDCLDEQQQQLSLGESHKSILGFLGETALQVHLKEDFGVLLDLQVTYFESNLALIELIRAYLKEKSPQWQQELCQAYLACLRYQPDNPQESGCWLSTVDIALYAELTNRSIVIWNKKSQGNNRKPFLVRQDKDSSFYSADSTQQPLHLLYDSSHFDRLEVILPEAANHYANKLEDTVNILSQSVDKLTDKVKRLEEKPKKKKVTTASQDSSLAQNVSVPPVSPENSAVHELPVSEPRPDLEGQESQNLPGRPQQGDFVSRLEYETKIKDLQKQIEALEKALQLQGLLPDQKLESVGVLPGNTNTSATILAQHSFIAVDQRRKRRTSTPLALVVDDANRAGESADNQLDEKSFHPRPRDMSQ